MTRLKHKIQSSLQIQTLFNDNAMCLIGTKIKREIGMNANSTFSFKFRLATLFLAICCLFGCDRQDKGIADIKAFIAQADIDTTNGSWKQGLPKPPQVTFDPSKQYLWHLETNKGKLVVDLKAQESPMHVSSTIYLTTLGFYDNLVFHRVIPGFMAQGGDPLGVGVGGPGYTYMGEFESTLSHDKPGILSMANSGAGTDGSQFFLTFKATPHLNGLHTIFGEVIEGLAVLKELEKYGSRTGKTSEKVFIQKATIEVK